MPISIRVAVGLFVLAAIHGVGQVAYAWSSIYRPPHHQPLLYYAWIPIYTMVCLPMILGAVLAGVTLFKGRFMRLTVISSGMAALIFPLGTLATLVTLVIARQHFSWWYQRYQ